MSSVTGRRCFVIPTRVSHQVCSVLCQPSEWIPVSKRIQAKREELTKRRDMLEIANTLLEDQRDDDDGLDMLLHAERYDDLNSYPQLVLTSHQQ